MPESFTDVQYQFTRHIRDPNNVQAPEGIEERRMAIYRDLLYRNVESFMANSFPVLRKILKDDEWHSLMRDYFKTHQSRTPLFPKMPQEFLQYLDSTGQHPPKHLGTDPRLLGTDLSPSPYSIYPFIRELAHYEWVELALSIDSREIRRNGINENGDLLSATPVLNQLSWSLTCQYPAHRIGPDYLPSEKPEQPTCLLVYRDRQDSVRFIELNPVTARLVDCLKENEDKKNGRDILMEIAHEIRHPDPEVVVNGGRDILEDMRNKQIVLGTEIRGQVAHRRGPGDGL